MIYRKDAAKEFIKTVDKMNNRECGWYYSEYAWYFTEHDQIHIVDAYDNRLMERDAKVCKNIIYLGVL